MPKSSDDQTRLPLLFYADGYRFPDVYHTTRFLAPDPIIALEDVEELVLVTSSLRSWSPNICLHADEANKDATPTVTPTFRPKLALSIESLLLVS